MSLFIAVRPDLDAVEDLQEVIARVRRLPPAENVRWQAPSFWHVTLAFLGDPDPLAVDDVAERMTDLGTHRPVEGIRLAGAGCFGREVLWMGLADDAAGTIALTALGRIVTDIPRLLRGSGVTLDRRPWRPHLTVGRTRRSDARPVVAALADYSGPPWTVDAVLLIRSTGGPRPTHHVVASTDLIGPS